MHYDPALTRLMLQKLVEPVEQTDFSYESIKLVRPLSFSVVCFAAINRPLVLQSDPIGQAHAAEMVSKLLDYMWMPYDLLKLVRMSVG